MNQVLVEKYFELLMSDGLGLDMSDPNLSGTPERVARMFCEEFFAGVDNEFPAEDLRAFPNDEGYNEVILFHNIPFVSVCSHHFLPFTGKAWFLYIPRDKVLEEGNALLCGASKPTRLIQHYAARPQLQERLAKQVVSRFVELINPVGVMLVMEAVHGCMSCRGVKNGNDSGMINSVVHGAFKDNPQTRNEALSLIHLSVKLR